MNLRGIKFEPVWCASGALGFFGEGYWFHDYGNALGLDFQEATFVAKTTTLLPCRGNMELYRQFFPKKLFPDCIVVKPVKKAVLNAVHLSGPGAHALFKSGYWQERQTPFFISFMSVGNTYARRREELKQFVDVFRKYAAEFTAPVGLQINYSCSSVEIPPEELAKEAVEDLTAAAELAVPLVPKFNILLQPALAVKISEHPACDALCVSNTIPWGKIPEKIDWCGLFGSAISPLARYGGGGLSGAPLLPLLLDWISEAKKAGLKKPINAGGGILSINDAQKAFSVGADSISLGSVALLRPWRVRKIIAYVRARY